MGQVLAQLIPGWRSPPRRSTEPITATLFILLSKKQGDSLPSPSGWVIDKAASLTLATAAAQSLPDNRDSSPR